MAKRYNIVTRCIAALALVFVYFVSTSAVLVGTSAILVVASTSSAEARFHGGGRGFGRGFRGRGFGRGFGYYGGYYGPGCYWSYRWGRYICPYY